MIDGVLDLFFAGEKDGQTTEEIKCGVVILFAYFGLAWIIMLVLRVFGTRFKIVPFSFTPKVR